MSRIPGTTLDKLWPTMSAPQKHDIAMQLHDILKKMRALKPP